MSLALTHAEMRRANDDLRVAAFLALVIAAGLYVDQRLQPWGQDAVDVAVALVYVWLVLRSDRPRRIGLIACLALASIGECTASLVWGLYTYRLHNVPLFVPPGHALLYTVGVALAARMPQHIVRWVPALAAPYVALALARGFSTFDAVLYGVFALCLWRGQAKKLYATMFVLSLAMELYGTWLGNWHWWPRVPGVGLTATNPPAAAGAFYCVLDVLVVAWAVRIEARLRRQESERGGVGMAIPND